MVGDGKVEAGKETLLVQSLVERKVADDADAGAGNGVGAVVGKVGQKVVEKKQKKVVVVVVLKLLAPSLGRYHRFLVL